MDVHVGIFRAFTWPGFFLSTARGSLVTTPADKLLVEHVNPRLGGVYLVSVQVSATAHEPSMLSQPQE